MPSLICKTYTAAFPNPSISSSKWDFDGFRKDRLKGLSSSVAVFVSTMGSVSLGSSIYSVTTSVPLSLFAFLVSYFALVFLVGKMRNLIINTSKHKREEYRREHLSTFIQLFEQKGWEILSLDGLVRNKKSYILDENRVRHSLEVLFIGETEILILLTLSDDKAKTELKATKKQECVDFQVGHYENNHGVMSPEEKLVSSKL
jgi:hypothetical protein